MIPEANRIVTADKVEIKPLFVEKYTELLGNRYDEFIDASFRYLRKCIRVNTLKISPADLHKRLVDQGWKLTPVPWCAEGFFIDGHQTQHRFDVGNLIEHALGYFYVQEAASMIPPVALFKTGKDGEHPVPSQELRVLDLCAAPGSKTTQLAQYMENKGTLVANDADAPRLRPLSLNLQRLGVHNVIITKNTFQLGASMKFYNPFEGEAFDAILVDAPCSGTGTIRRSFKTLEMYSTSLVQRMCGTQKALLTNAWQLLKPGGILIYSTCTLEPEENEAIVSHLLSKNTDAQLLDIDLNIRRSKPITEWKGKQFHSDVEKCLRIYPQDNDGEGFFVAKFCKKE